MNDSATIPASLTGRHAQSGEAVELRLAQSLGEEPSDLRRWRGILLGRGDWRLATEKRGRIPQISAGDTLNFRHDLSARVIAVSNRFGQLVEVEFSGEKFDVFRKIYLAGQAIQYSYLQEELKIWDQQTIFAGPAASVEPPSASFPLDWRLFFRMRAAGVEVTSITHSAGLSSTGDPELDKILPFPERYWISPDAARAINHALDHGRRIIALGSTVTRALESAGTDGRVKAGSAVARVLLDSTYARKIVTGIITGMHDPGSSHLRMLSSFVSSELLGAAYEQALDRGYLWHEYGDSCLILD